MNDSKMIDMEIESSRELFVGKTLESVTRKGDGVEYRFKEGGYFWQRSHIPVNEHKLALLEKALELATKDSNYWLGELRSEVGNSTPSDYILEAEIAIKDKEAWRPIFGPILYPKWIEDREEKPE
jgi:hypothetical protein